MSRQSAQAFRQQLINGDGEVRELSSEDFKYMRPASEILSKELMSVLTKRRQLSKSNSQKTELTSSLNGEIVDFSKPRAIVI